MLVCVILVPRLGIGPMPPAVEARSLNHWTARESTPFVLSLIIHEAEETG